MVGGIMIQLTANTIPVQTLLIQRYAQHPAYLSKWCLSDSKESEFKTLKKMLQMQWIENILGYLKLKLISFGCSQIQEMKKYVHYMCIIKAHIHFKHAETFLHVPLSGFH